MIVQQITPRHLQRLAFLYVRQSTLQQVLENTESTARQYALPRAGADPRLVGRPDCRD